MDLQLLAALVLGIATVVVLILRTRFDAFIALLVAAIVTALIAGVPVAEAITMITEGFGTTLGGIGIVIGLGVMIGKLLEVSGAAEAIARNFVRASGRNREEWALAGTGYVVSIPVFVDSAFVIMHPLARSLAARTGRSLVMLSIALAGGLVITHHLVPPTPGPLAVSGIVGVPVGELLLAGLVFALLLVPAVVAYARWVGPRLDAFVGHDVAEKVVAGAPQSSGSGSHVARTDAERDEPTGPRVSLGRAVLPLLVPLLLIVGNTVSTAVAEDSAVTRVLSFVGSPVVALLVGTALALYTLLPRETPRAQVHTWLAQAAGSAGLIILITGASGALGAVLRGSGVGDELAQEVAKLAVPGFLVPFLVATLVRLAQGSGTVAMITAASVSAPLVGTLGLDPLVAALACCTGAFVFSYFNDSFFWVMTRFTGLEGTPALRAWSGTTTVAWAASIPLLAVASVVLG